MSATRIRIPDQVEDFFRTARPGRRRLLALTYRFNSGAFERQFGRVLARGIQVDVVMGDDPPAGGVQYRIWRANWPGTFHPKVLLLLANDEVKAGLGSANLTAGGLGENLEAWAFFGGRDGASILAGVRHLLERLKSEQVLPRSIDVDEFITALPKGASALISTLDGTMLAQVQERLRGPIRKLDIVSPLHADPSGTIAALRKICPRQEFHLYTDAAQVPCIPGIDGYWTLHRPAPRNGNEEIRVVSQAHAKIYAFHGSDYVDLFWGSANLSYRAWMAKGRAANVDVLVHSRVPHREWQSFLHALPAGHTWKETKPRPVTFPPINEEEGASWRLLHGTLEGGELVLDATGSGPIPLRLRVSKRGQGLKVRLNFAERSAPVDKATARRLGFGSQAPPGELEWSFDKPRAWRTIPVNVLDTVPGEDGELDLASMLFWRYAGRPLPRATRDGLKSSKAHPPTSEEEELTRSVYQCALDEFVLKWRLVARSIAAASHGNDQLRLHRVCEALRMIKAEAQRCPATWPAYRLAFVKELLEREWPK